MTKSEYLALVDVSQRLEGHDCPTLDDYSPIIEQLKVREAWTECVKVFPELQSWGHEHQWLDTSCYGRAPSRMCAVCRGVELEDK